jgi:DNA transformation protein
MPRAAAAPHPARAKPARRAQPAAVARSLALLMPLGPVVPRGMFGGWGFFLDGTMIALVAGDALYLKTDATTRPRFEAAGSQAFVYRGRKGPVATSYWRAPAGSEAVPEAMLAWAELAVAAARRAAARKATRRRR